jgi:hypothetical protein
MQHLGLDKDLNLLHSRCRVKYDHSPPKLTHHHLKTNLMLNQDGRVLAGLMSKILLACTKVSKDCRHKDLVLQAILNLLINKTFPLLHPVHLLLYLVHRAT